MSSTAIDLAIFEELKQMSGAEFIDELIDTFLDDAPRLISELKSSLKAGNADSFRRAAHSLKSNGATFGAGHFAELARELEMIGKESRLGDAGDHIQELESAFAVVASELKDLHG